MAERALINFFYAQQVGHAVEALHYANGHHVANPDWVINLALNAATAVELADLCPFVSDAYAIDHPFLESCPDSADRLAGLPRDWDWILEDPRRHLEDQLGLFAGMRDYYAASDLLLQASRRRTVVGNLRVGYARHRALRFQLPQHAGANAQSRLGDGSPTVVVMPAGSSESSLYPSGTSWRTVFDALADAFPAIQIVLTGRLARDERSNTALSRRDLDSLLAHRTRPIDCFDIPMVEQLGFVESADVFISPHTGFGLAALAVGTPWLTLSGGRWFEYYFNHVSFRSIIPDTERFPSFSQFEPADVVIDGEDGPRTPSMSQERIQTDLERIVIAVEELATGSVSYERCLRDYFHDLFAAHGGETSSIWSIDNVHLDYT